MRGKLGAAFALAALGTMSIAAIAPAVSTPLPPPTLTVGIGSEVLPQKLSRGKYAPVTWRIFGKIKTTDGTHPSAFREAVVDVDKDVRMNVRGYPACGMGQLRERTAKAALRACRDALLGEGKAQIEIASGSAPPTLSSSRLLVFNGGGSRLRAQLLVHAFVAESEPAAIVTTIELKRKGPGLHTIARIPAVAGGTGSLLSFNFEVGATHLDNGHSVGYFEAKCPDDVFKVSVPKLLFRNEAGVPGVASSTVLKGGLAVPCTPKG